MPDKNLSDEPASPPVSAEDESDTSAPSSPLPDTPADEWDEEEDYMFVKSRNKKYVTPENGILANSTTIGEPNDGQ